MTDDVPAPPAIADPLALVDDAFRAAVLAPAAPPTRFFVNLSERCQLSCAHCITDAPSLTSSGRARDLSPAVLEALAPHLAHAAWLGLVHAGEPMLAPQFAPLLDVVRARRAERGAGGGAPAVVHLLTNGMAMTRARFEEVCALGVTSLSFSLDGMSAATNDVLRIGARASLLLDRIGELSRARPAGLRMGVSFVVTKANLAELPALLRFARDAGLDWLKLEEVFAHNDASRALVVDRYALDVAVAGARRLGDELGVPVLDHTRALAVWKCKLDEDPRMAARARLDDLVNRADLNPCRAPWEVVCVEPNGDVKPLSFHHPAAGNLVGDDLLALWRGAPGFVEARRTARATRLCGAGPATCPRDPGPAAW